MATLEIYKTWISKIGSFNFSGGLKRRMSHAPYMLEEEIFFFCGPMIDRKLECEIRTLVIKQIFV